MAKEYATIETQHGRIHRVGTDAPNGSAGASQFNGLASYPLVFGLNKLDELGYAPLQGAIDHGETQTAGANYTLICVREK